MLEMVSIHSASGGVMVQVVTLEGEPIEDAQFTLSLDGVFYQKGIKSDAQGSVFLEGLPTGSYVLRQTSSMEGYEVAKEPYSFYYQEQQSLELPDIINKKMLGSIGIELVDGNGAALAQEPFDISIKDEHTTFRSDAAGRCTIEHLEIGDYMIQVRDKATTFSITSKNYQNTIELKVYAEKKVENFDRKPKDDATLYLFLIGTLSVVGVGVVCKKSNFMKWLHETDQHSE